MDSSDPEARLALMREHYLVGLEPLPEVDIPLASPFREVALAFRQNLHATITVVALPFSLASASVQQAAVTRIVVGETIRSGVPVGARDLTPAEAAAAARADEVILKRWREFRQSKDGLKELIEGVSQFLVSSLDAGGMEDAARELLLQGTASLWTAIEVLARDLFVAYVNANPESVRKLTSSPETRRRFEAAKFSIDDLAGSAFNLASSMGTLLSRQQDLSDYRTIKATFEALFEPCQVFSDRETGFALELLNQQRHLIVHRRGIVDERYRELTGGAAPVGTQLSVSPTEFEEHARMCFQTGRRLLALVTVDAEGQVRGGCA